MGVHSSAFALQMVGAYFIAFQENQPLQAIPRHQINLWDIWRRATYAVKKNWHGGAIFVMMLP